MCYCGVHGNGSFAMYREGCCESSFLLGCSWCWFNVQWSSWGEDNLLPNKTLSEVADWDIGELPGCYVHSDPSLNWVLKINGRRLKCSTWWLGQMLSPFALHGSVSAPDIAMFILYRDLNGVEKVNLCIVNPRDLMLLSFDCSALWVEVHPFADC